MSGKRSKTKWVRMYSHDHYGDMDDEDGIIIIGILVCAVGLWWGLIHLFDKFTFNIMPWWAEPLTIFPVGGYFIVADFYGKNLLHWWPIIWGYKIKMPEKERVVLHPIDGDELVKKYGGPLNVYVVDPNYIKFRTKKDAVKYCLFN